VDPNYVRTEILPEFFKNFWVRRMALDRRNYKQLVDTTVELANKVGSAEIITRVVDDLKDESEPYRKMVMEAIERIVSNLGASDIDGRLEEQLIDGILYAFQEQTTDDTQVMLNGFGTVVNSLGLRVKPYLPQICGTIKWRLNNKAAKTRQQAADLIGRIAVVMKSCGEEQLMGHLGIPSSAPRPSLFPFSFLPLSLHEAYGCYSPSPLPPTHSRLLLIKLCFVPTLFLHFR
jgi:splicing factor 3B subunit 1